VADIAVAMVAVVAWWYGLGVRRMWRHAGVGHGVRRWEVASFGAGLLTTAIALSPWLDGAANRSLTAHMVQHLLLMTVAAPLLVVGEPLPPMVWALPGRLRKPAGRLTRALNRSATGGGWFVWAAVALVVSTVVLWVWHLPALYDAALRHAAVHGAEHGVLFGAALLLWWVVAGARRRSTFAPGVLVVFVTTLPATLLGAALALTAHPWYPWYVDAFGGRTAAALTDQQVAGVLMWASACVPSLLGATALFAAWLVHADRVSPANGVKASVGADPATTPPPRLRPSR
jgi:putative membrane protein